MNPAEAAVMLAAISANDNREVTEAASRAWAAALPDVALQDALDFLPSYYRTATRDGRNWIYPGDVLAGVVELHRDRKREVMRQAREDALAGDIAEDEREMVAMRAQIAAGKRYSAAHRVPDAKVSAESARVLRQFGIEAS